MKFIERKTKIIPSLYLPILRQAIEEQGYNFEQILDKAKISADSIDHSDSSLSYIHFKTVLKLIIKEVADENFGLAVGKYLNINSHGDLGIAAMSSKNIHDAILLAIKYIKMQMPLLDLQFILENDDAIIRITTKHIKGTLKKFILDATIASLHTIRAYFLNKKHITALLRLNYKEPKDLNSYHDLFGAKLYFNTPYAEYVFPKKELEVVFPLANQTIKRIAEEKCQQKLAALEGHVDLLSVVKKYLLSTPGHFPQLPDIASKLHLSDRTLKRYLNQLDANYQEILNNTRCDLAIKYLLTTDLAIAEISQLLDYRDPSNFGTAFKKWTGQSPHNYRKLHG